MVAASAVRGDVRALLRLGNAATVRRPDFEAMPARRVGDEAGEDLPGRDGHEARGGAGDAAYPWFVTRA